MTEPKPWLRPMPLTRRCTPALLKARLKEGRSLRWHPAVRVAWFDAKRACHLFVDGMHYPLPGQLKSFVQLLGDARRLEAAKLARYANSAAVETLLLRFINAGQCSWTR